MVRHILLLQPRTDTTPEALEAAIETARKALAALVGVIPGLVDFHWGTNLAEPARRDGFSLGFSMDFTDRPSLDAYGPHPQHKVAAGLVRAAFERILVLDITL